jgi:hypothetical protein
MKYFKNDKDDDIEDSLVLDHYETSSWSHQKQNGLNHQSPQNFKSKRKSTRHHVESS